VTASAGTTPRVAVLGRGLAGAAAAWSAARHGASVASFGQAGLATQLSSGALDWLPWERQRGRPPVSLPPELIHFFDELGGYLLPTDASAIVATSSGVLREARAHDAHVLDLAALAPAPGLTVGPVLVPRVNRPGWDADSLAVSWSAERWALARKLEFVAVDADFGLLQSDALLPDADWASRLRDPGRLQHHLATVASCRARVPGASAMLAPAGFGLISADSAPEWARPGGEGGRGLPIGEVLSGPGGPAGARLSAALTRSLPPPIASAARLPVVPPVGGRFVLEVDGRDTEPFDSVVLAVGGVLSGGLELARTDPAAILSAIPRFHAPSFPGAWIGALSPAHEGAIELPPDDLRWGRDLRTSWLEAVGILHATESPQVLAARDTAIQGLFVAGDAAAGHSRTALLAVATGLEAGKHAAQRRAAGSRSG
jgi:hypothetical protein